MSLAVLALTVLATAEPASVLLVTLDTFRGDYVTSTTIHLKELAARGTSFSRARAPIPLTLPSHASIVTGLYPPEHGVRDNGAYRLADEHTTLAEVLSARGYQTAAFVSSFVLDPRFGLAQGFDTYDAVPVRSDADLENPQAERKGGDAATAFESWHAALDPDRPFFAWIHLYDPHAPYDSPEPFRSRHRSDPYTGEIAYTDSVVGRVLESIDLSHTVVAVTGDHGEGLGEHGETTHALLIYNSTLHVPLIFAGPGIAEGQRSDALVRTIDVAATILDALDLGDTFGTGTSLIDATDTRTAYSESTYARRHLGWSSLYGLETSTHRFIEAPHRELFSAASDPGELKNLLESERAVSRSLFRELETMRNEFGASAAEEVIDDDTRRALESLGYMTTAAAGGDDAGRPDPKERIDTYETIQTARAERALGRCEDALETLAAVDEPIPLVYEVRSQCAMTAGRFGEAEAVLREAIALGLESASFHLNLGVAAFQTGKLADAEKELRVALAMDPRNVTAHYRLGAVLAAQRRHREAIASLETAVTLNADYVYAWNELGKALARTGRNEGALAAFRSATSSRAAPPLAFFNLAVQLERMGHDEDAAASYRRFLEISEETSSPRERARARDALARLTR